MKYKIIFLIASLIVLFGACEDMHEKTEKYYGEVVYPAKFDTIYAHIGYERAEIDLLRAGRIPSNEIKLGKAKKTIIEYDEERIVFDEIKSWVNISGLTQSKIYRFYIYTEDEFGNQSVPQEIAVIPYTANDLETTIMTAPRITYSPSSAILEWPAGLNSLMVRYFGMTYEYTDRDGNVVKGERGDNPRIFIGNLETGKSYTVKMRYKIVPVVDNVPILDTLMLDKEITLNIPASTGTFSPSERDILNKNGLTTFDFESASKFKKLVFPVETNSLQDLFYFSNIEELDLTGGDLFELKKYTYDRNSVQSTVGGGKALPFLSNVNNINDVQVIKDLLEAGTLKKVRYMPNTMYGLDEILAPFVESGVVELTNVPDEYLIPNNFIIDGRVQDGNFEMTYTFNPSDAPAGTGLENVYKVVPKKKSASFVIALPTEYRFNAKNYKYLKFRYYTPPASAFTGDNANFKYFWPRLMNYMWSFGGNSNYGQETWNADVYTIPEANMANWSEFTLDISRLASTHNRVIIINIGGEKGIDPSGDPLNFYLSNIRLTK